MGLGRNIVISYQATVKEEEESGNAGANTNTLILRHELSSEQFKSGFYTWAGFLDWFYTYSLRFPRIWDNDCLQNLGQHPVSQGPTINLLVKHPIGALILLIIIFTTGVFALFNYYRQQKQEALIKEKRAQSTYKAIKALNVKPSAPQQQLEIAPQEDAIESKITDDQIKELNRKLAEAIKNKPDSFRRVRSGRFEKNNRSGVDFKFGPEISTNIIWTIWDAMAIDAVAYWLFWIAMLSIIGGLTATTGIPGFTPMASFLAPFLFGLTYIAIKTYHWISHYYYKTDPSSEEAIEANQLMQEINGERAEQIKKEGKEWWILMARCVAAGCVAAMSAGLFQYALWYWSDTFPIMVTATVPLLGPLANVLGIASFGVAALFGYVGARTKYRAIMSDQTDGNDLTVAEKIEFTNTNTQIEEKEKKLNELQGYTGFFWNRARNVGNLLSSTGYQFFDWGMSGAFIGRLFLFPNTSPFMPSALHLAAHAAICVHPIILCTAVGLTWAIFRLCVQKVEARFAERSKFETAKNKLIHLTEIERERDIKTRCQKSVMLKEFGETIKATFPDNLPDRIFPSVFNLKQKKNVNVVGVNDDSLAFNTHSDDRQLQVAAASFPLSPGR